jgi:hypothetical protein
VAQGLLDLGHVLVGEPLKLLLRPMKVVFGDLAVLLQPLELFFGMATNVPHRNSSVLGSLVDQLGEVLPPLLGELGKGQPDHHAIVRRGQAQVGLQDGLLHGRHGVLVERLDHQEPGLGHRERRQLVNRRVGSVVVDGHPIEDGR